LQKTEQEKGIQFLRNTGSGRVEEMLKAGYFDPAHQTMRVDGPPVMNGTGDFSTSRPMLALSFATDSRGRSITVEEAGTTRPVAAWPSAFVQGLAMCALPRRQLLYAAWNKPTPVVGWPTLLNR